MQSMSTCALLLNEVRVKVTVGKRYDDTASRAINGSAQGGACIMHGAMVKVETSSQER
jgi:hypothetical protein